METTATKATTPVGLNTVLYDFDGTSFKASEPVFAREANGAVKTGADGEPVILKQAEELTLHHVLMRAVRTVQEHDAKMDDASAMRLYLLGHKLAVKDATVSFTSEEVTMLKTRMKAMYGVPVYMRACEIIDPAMFAAAKGV